MHDFETLQRLNAARTQLLTKLSAKKIKDKNKNNKWSLRNKPTIEERKKKEEEKLIQQRYLFYW